MSDPITIGVLASSMLAMAGEVILKSVAGEVVKDAYSALKKKVAAWSTNDMEAFEKTPTSAARQAVIAETIDRQSPEDQAEIKRLAAVLNDALREAASATPIGIDVGRLEAARVELTAIDVTRGTGIRADEIKTPGDFTVGRITVGKPQR